MTHRLQKSGRASRFRIGQKCRTDTRPEHHAPAVSLTSLGRYPGWQEHHAAFPCPIGTVALA